MVYYIHKARGAKDSGKERKDMKRKAIVFWSVNAVLFMSLFVDLFL
jgi:hypothetical protein